jgi:CDP-glucose 4,6-dehydratase
MKKLLEVYKNKRVLVTGHTGFKGAWLSLWLSYLGAEVAGYSLKPPTTPSLFDVINLKDKMISIEGDIRDENKLKEVFQQCNPEIVFHLAAQPLVRLSYIEPKLTYETNVMGTLNLLEAARAAKSVNVFINVTSDKCYENKEQNIFYKETDCMGGYDPYSSSKAMSEILTSAYRNSFFNPKDFGKTHNLALSSARAGNVIGGGDWAEDRLLPDCVRNLSAKKKIVIRNPHAVRPWQLVLDPVFGYLLLGVKMLENPLGFSGGWNFGPDNIGTQTVEEIVESVIDIWGEGKFEIIKDSSLHEAKLLMLDNGKAKKELHWKPLYDINKTVDKTIGWYKKYYSSKEDMFKYSQNQIEEYMLGH